MSSLCCGGWRTWSEAIFAANDMKVIFSGLESSGKSLKLAMLACSLVERNARWNALTGRSRPIVSNMHFAPAWEEWAASKGVEILYWKDLDELIRYDEADIICDEVGNYFDARMWADLSLEVRRWLTQGAKQGIEFYGGAQDFAQVDKAFRRLVQPGDLVHITKIAGSRRPSATKPPVRFIWGICSVSKLDPQGYDEDKKRFASAGIPSFFFIRREFCEVFDTRQKIERSKPAALRHIDRACELPDCHYHKVQHV